MRGVKDRIRDLRSLERAPASISRACEGGIAWDCPIIEWPYGVRP